jgi:hypothetical protein
MPGFRGSGFLQASRDEDIHPARFDIALINPPFSIDLESPPRLKPLACTTWDGTARALAR